MVVGIKAFEVGRLVGPAEHGHGPERRREPGIENVRVLLQARVLAGRAGRRIFHAADRRAFGALRFPVARLSRNTRRECDAPTRSGATRTSPSDCAARAGTGSPSFPGTMRTFPFLLASRAFLAMSRHRQKPLLGFQRLDDGVAAVADGERDACSPRPCREGPALRDRPPPSCALQNGPGPRSRRPASAVILPSKPMTVMCGSFWRSAISKSVGSWAGVTFTAPEPKVLSTTSSATMGISRPVSGSCKR